jgi:3-hydroxyacyl-[acyl-carrier-protein] dehydratase
VNAVSAVALAEPVAGTYNDTAVAAAAILEPAVAPIPAPAVAPIAETPVAAPSKTAPPESAPAETTRTAPDPNRAAPLRAVDRHEILSAHEITAEKLIRADDPYLSGHYPDFTIYPGIFVIESVTQTAHILVEQTWESRIGIELAAIKSVRFVAPLLPGDTLHLRCLCTYSEEDLLTVKADCRNDRGERTAQMRLEFRLVKAVCGD